MEIINKECFGHYTFEDIECMTCEQYNRCQSKIREERRDSISFRFPQCKGCSDILYCKDHLKCRFIKYRCLKNICDRYGYSYIKNKVYIFTYNGGYCRKEELKEDNFYITESFKDRDIFEQYFERV